MGSQRPINRQLALDIESAALGCTVEKPLFQMYAAKLKRLETFESWSDSIPVNKDDLAEVGFMSMRDGDRVRCYFCGGCLNNWEIGDIPIEEHESWFPKCYHVFLVKAAKYIDKFNRIEKNNGASNSGETVGVCGEVDSAATNECLEMGYSRDMIERAIAIYMEKTGKCDYDAAQLCAILLALKFDNSDTNDFQDVNRSGFEDAEAEDVTDEDDQEIKQINEELKRLWTCKICMDKTTEIVFIPCGHAIACQQCATVLSVCPICRKTITSNVRLVS